MLLILAVVKESRCKEIRRRVSWGAVDYAALDGDAELKELVKPIFKKKRLVIWSIDHHYGPIADIRSLIEPLGVEFIEHDMSDSKTCHRLCACNMSRERRSFYYVGPPTEDVYNQISRDKVIAPDIDRADAFLVTFSIPFVEFFSRYNKSIILVSSIRFDYITWRDANRWIKLNSLIGALTSERRHIIGANNLYDLEYMHYFTGARPDYVPSFSAYAGEHYNPSRHSFLYGSNPTPNFPFSFFTEPFDREYMRINATFKLYVIKTVYKSGFEYSDLVQHLGIVHLPYDV